MRKNIKNKRIIRPDYGKLKGVVKKYQNNYKTLQKGNYSGIIQFIRMQHNEYAKRRRNRTDEIFKKYWI
ncbi:MAG: hypothetical protein ACLRZ9_02090 [Eubacterium sp.]